MWKYNTRYHVGHTNFGNTCNASVNTKIANMIASNGDGTFEVTKLSPSGNAIEFKCGLTGKILNKEVAREEYNWPEYNSFLYWSEEASHFKVVDMLKPETICDLVLNEGVTELIVEGSITINQILKSEEDRLALITTLNKVKFK